MSRHRLLRAARTARALLYIGSLAAASAEFAIPAVASAQVGATTDILSGTVKNAQGQPLAGATVTAISVETQLTRTKTTDAKGHYVIVFPDGGGRYQLTVRAIGVQPRTLLVQRSVDEDQLITNVTMGGSSVQQLSAVTVRDNARDRGLGNANDRPTPGSQERTFNPDQLSKLPLADASDLAAIAALTPGVVGITGSDSTSNAFSVAGQRLTDNNVTLDGLSFGSGSVPQDAVRNTRVITNTYDAARGQFSGGQIASTTRRGTNLVQGSFTDQFRDPSLAFQSAEAGAFGRAYHQNTLSGGLGGPIIKNKLFVFGSFQVRGRTDPLQSLLSANAATLQRLGVSPDSVGQFLGALSRYGIAPTTSSIPGDRSNDQNQLFLRFDGRLTESHTLMLRFDGQWNDAAAQRIASLGLPSSGGSQTRNGFGVMASLTSQLTLFNGAVINEIRAYRSTADQQSDPYLSLPAGRVQILSALSDNALSTSTLQFGGNAGLPQASDNVTFESSDELSFIPAGSGHRFKLGALLNHVQNDQDFTANRLGTFTYNSLADFLANRPSQYTRTLTPQQRNGQSTNAALYAGDTWRWKPTVQLTYGVRLEGSEYGGAPALNPQVEQFFGYRTDRFPTEVHLSPRIGFSWSPRWNTTSGTPEQQGRVAGNNGGGSGGRGNGGGGGGRFGGGFGGAGGGPATTFRGGVGEFRALAPTQVFSSAQSATGLSNTESQLVCIGAAVPTPDFSAYALGTAALPTQCAGGLASSPINTARPNVTVIDPGFQAPRSWRGSLGVTQRVKERLSLSLDLNYARGVAQYGFRDANLDATPEFTLRAEGGRPVFVPAATIVPTTGAVSLFASRVHPEFGRVLVATSNLASDTKQATLGLNAFTRRGIQANLSYTFMRSRDQTSFPGGFGGFGVANTTAGDPNVSAWGRSDLERRHQIQAIVSWPAVSWLEVSAVGRLSSGSPYTPVVGGDINGDGSRNDQAFVFDPASAPDTAVANGMRRLLAAAPSAVSDCLTRSLGKVAGRASCTGPWQPSLDLSANFRPTFLNLDRRLTLTVSTQNLLGGLDQLVHGVDNLHGWGSQVRPDATLLTVRGFDPQAQAFRYTVNERFGQTRGSANAFRVPFQLSLQARLAVGPDPVRDRLRGVFGGATAANGRSALDRLASAMPSVVDSVLARKDSLALTDSQVVKLRALGDSVKQVNGPLADSLSAMLQKAGSNPDPRTLMGTAGPLLQRLRQSSTQATRAVQAILTPEQWALLPESVRNANRGRGGFGGPGGPGGEGRRPIP
ncbi:hypothetical protein J421_5378 (plasmid) [Gemmatirosa kalamazoonensis]|uniref:TonB-dependent transporter Oar-like beta-barrel domain-containing protein n=1 Tax=Gemmatirosa kalamazoonensis TaxID=861299 RepID=W0RTJ9_9BACT|nr:carboxypeptidase regulatory-like domain-containing protein [Gemmatirosa kalamazoonensis]AHG92913.1 hypothetical protein J421_5378 [Gemmatirosa kalamazoonensis]